MKAHRYLAYVATGLLPLAAHAEDDIFLGTILISAPTLEDPEGEEIDITSDELALTNPSDLSELFVAEPTVQVGSSIPLSQKLYVNGIEENNLAISIDGARQNNKIFHHNTTTLVDPGLLKAARIDPGVAPADAGPGALAGALAYETKDVADLLSEDANFGGRYRFEYQSNGDIVANSLTLYGQQSGFEYLGYLKYATGNTQKDGSGNEIIGSATDLLSGLVKTAYQTEEGSRFELSYERVRDDEVRPYRANIGQIIGGRPVPLTRPYDLKRENVVFTYTEAEPKGLWDPKVLLAYSSSELFLDESGLPTNQTVSGKTDSFNGEISNRFDFGWTEINAGLDFYNDTADTDYKSLRFSNRDEAASEKLRNIGVFAQVRMRPNDRTDLSFGLRGDFQDFTGVDGSKQSTSGVSGNFAAQYNITDQFTVSAGYSNVWGGIELAENFIMNPAWSYPATGIEDVTSENVFVAAKYDVGVWVANAKYFHTKIDNARAASYRAGPAETADLESKGYELGFGYAWNGGFVRVGYANIDTDINGRTADSFTGNYLTMPMGEFVSLQAAHQFNNGLLIGGDAQVAFDYDDTYDFATRGRGPELPGYTVVNVFAQYTPKKMQNLTLRAEVSNLFDETYANRATYGQEFVGEVVALNEPGRSLRLMAEIEF
ncbi:TonB-dependent receptor [Roseibium sp. RKSG952]|uniref:TonB-dependent receptor domain-containing protein n=1 Tax=Roseibium sp. RKSG952 TaxID=2529384 RepID=UPI0012BCAF53|nr:TonB-dependent receptor [Roseibium sp. RKSG952]MTI02005.1 TonB-dependent receptor [Roseibium sp. RKSG952]